MGRAHTSFTNTHLCMCLLNTDEPCPRSSVLQLFQHNVIKMRWNTTCFAAFTLVSSQVELCPLCFFWIPHIFNSHFNYLKATRTLKKVKMLWEALSTMVHMQQFYRYYIQDEGTVMCPELLLLTVLPWASAHGGSKFKLQIIGGGQLHEVLEWFNYPLQAPTFE